MPPYATIHRRMPPQAAKFTAIAVVLYIVWLEFEGMGLKDFLWQWVGDLVVHCVRAKMEIGMVTLGFDDIQDLWFI